MATEEYQLGYEAGYQDGWNAAQQPQRRPSYKEWTTDYVRDNLHKLKQPQAEAPVIAQNKAAPVASWDDSRTQKVYEVLTNDNYPPKGSADHWEGWKARLVVDALFPAQPQAEPYTYASKQATACADCGEHKHTPLRIDAMGGYVCLTCIDKKLGSLLGEFGYPEPQAEAVPADFRDRLVAISQAIADQDDRAAQAMIREILAAPQQAEAAPSSDLNPDEGDPVTLWAEIWRLREAVKGPDGYATWQDAATAERIRRVRAESKQAEASALIERMADALRSCSGVPHWPSFQPLINEASKWKVEAVPLLTDDEIDVVWDTIPQNQFWWRRYARAVEQKVRAKMLGKEGA